MRKQPSIPYDLALVEKLVFGASGFELTQLQVDWESEAYGACSFVINGQTIQYRESKITPTKIGQFVTVWKRGATGLTEPFAATDAIDYLVISAKNGSHFGQFVFPKSVLMDKGIISTIKQPGKRGIRIYPPWDVPTSKQALATQSWQLNYFLTIKEHSAIDTDLVKKLYSY